MVSQILDSADEIIKRILEKGLTKEEVMGKIKEKQEEYGGLLTEAGAAYSIAKELGIGFDFDVKNETKIGDLHEGLANVNLSARVDSVSPFREFEKNGRKGTVANVFVSDGTGKINVVLWNKEEKLVSSIKPGAEIRVLNAYMRERNGALEANVGNLGNVSVVKEGKEERVKLRDLQDNSFAEVRATIVDVYRPTILEICSKCGTMMKPDCKNCEKAEPVQTVIVNAELDDGTDVIRGTFYRATGEHFLAASGAELKENQALFEEKRRKLLGEEYILTGEAKFDKQFNRMNFIVRGFNNIDVQKELVRVRK
jgi:ssDNA-binding replication factor A large subunit